MMVLERLTSGFVPSIEYIEDEGLMSIPSDHRKVIEYLFTFPEDKKSFWEKIRINVRVNSAQTAASESKLITQIRPHDKFFLRFSVLPPGLSNNRRKNFQISFCSQKDCDSIITNIIDHLRERRRQYLEENSR